MCDEYTGKLNGAAVTAWFDPAAGHTLRRLTVAKTVIDVESSDANPAGLWLPTSWTVERPDGTGTRKKIDEYTVERVEVGKEPAVGEFAPTWPPGLRVVNNTTRENFTVEADGSLRRELGWWESVGQRFREWWVWAMVVAVLVGASGGVAIWRLRKRPKL